MSPFSVPDPHLVQRIAAGDQAALSALYDRYANLVFTVAFNALQDRPTAEEVTQDVFWRVWTKAEGYDPGRAEVSTWLCSIARYRAIDLLRQQGVRAESRSVGTDEVAPGFLSEPSSVEQAADITLLGERVRNAISMLPAKQREVLVWAYFGGYTHEEIARILKIPLGTAKTRIRLAMQRLRGLLAGD